jgi:hypothetical protein
MKNEKKSRRQFLALLGKTGLFLGSSRVFFASLKINPDEYAGTRERLSGASLALDEKALISGSASLLTVKVTGKPGRVFFATFAGTNVRENYRRIPGSDGVINARGTGSVEINIRNIPGARVYLKVITGEPNNMNSGLGATEPILLTIQKGVIQAFGGTISRPILDTKLEPSQAWIAMAATRENQILLR